MNSTIQHIGESGRSEQHNTAYRGKRTERGLGVTVVLHVWGVNIIMGKCDCYNREQIENDYHCYVVLPCLWCL